MAVLKRIKRICAWCRKILSQVCATRLSATLSLIEDNEAVPSVITVCHTQQRCFEVKMEQLILHLIGDYILQSDWMAINKGKRMFPAVCHVTFYSLSFLLIGSTVSVTVIWITHLLIDRFSLARYVVWIKNTILTPIWRVSGSVNFWTDNDIAKAGFHEDTPNWLRVVLTMIVDNSLHLAINYLALRYL